MTMKLGFVGDVHANARALDEALRILDGLAPDRIVFMGDLLSYGADVSEVLERVADRVARGAVVILGNHDRLYLDLLSGKQSYYDGLSEWIRESVDFTLQRLDAKVFSSLPFTHEHLEGDLLVAHANPFGKDGRGLPNWRYLRTIQDHADAAAALRARDLRVGVFGHTHRARIVPWPGLLDLGAECLSLRDWQPVGEADALVVNVGSVGQPRNLTATSMVGCMTRTPDARGATSVDIDILPLSYDVDGHLASLQKLPLSPGTIGALQAFFVPAA